MSPPAPASRTRPSRGCSTGTRTCRPPPPPPGPPRPPHPPPPRPGWLAAIAELGYRRNLSARVLATGRSNVIGVVAQNTTLYGPSSMVQAIGEAALGADLSLTVGHGAGYDATAASRRIVERLVQQGAAGLVFIAPVDAAAEAMRIVPPGVPIVTVDGLPEWRTANVSVDQYAGGLLATRCLLE